MNLQTILKRQKNNRHNNFQMEIGYENVKPIAFLYKKFTENSKWYKGSAIFALAPPIEALSRDLAVDWYFVTVAITPKTVDTKKPEASIFITDEMGRYNANGFIMKDDYWDLWECRNVKIEPYNNIQVELKTNPTTDKELYAIYKMMLEKIYPNIKIKNKMRKLSPQKQKIYDWLGEKNYRYLFYNEKLNRYRLSTKIGDKIPESYHTNTLKSLVNNFHLICILKPLYENETIYIHPKWNNNHKMLK